MRVEIKNISKSYRKKPVLRDISLTAQGGKCIGILGANGSGKSTLLSILAGVQRCDSGAFVCDGIDLFSQPRQRRELVGYVPQGTPLMEELSARDNLLLWYTKQELTDALHSGVLGLLDIGSFLSMPVSKLSGGMKKRLSIGCAMAKRPPILLLDEPTAALDLACKEQIAAYLRRYKASGGLLLLTTHDSMELELCDEWYVIKDGVLQPFAYRGDVSELIRSL